MQTFPPILSSKEHDALLQAKEKQQTFLTLSLDIQKSQVQVEIQPNHWSYQNNSYPYLKKCRPKTFYYWEPFEQDFLELSQIDPNTDGLIKLIPTTTGPPTFHISGIQMLPDKKVNPFLDAQKKVQLVRPSGKRILDTCGGLGYFAHFCLVGKAKEVVSSEINQAVIWLREKNPWSPSPQENPQLHLKCCSILSVIEDLEAESFQAILHDPPRFSIAGELYSLSLYQQFHRLLPKRGLLFHYTGSPFKHSHGRNFVKEVENRLQQAGFRTEAKLDGVFAIRK